MNEYDALNANCGSVENIAETGLAREHAEFHNSYREEKIKDGIKFLQSVFK